MSQPSAENLSERHNALAAYQQQLLRESERRRYGLFAADMAACVGELCTEYFIWLNSRQTTGCMSCL